MKLGGDTFSKSSAPVTVQEFTRLVADRLDNMDKSRAVSFREN
jgi:hypothetical protein